MKILPILISVGCLACVSGESPFANDSQSTQEVSSSSSTGEVLTPVANNPEMTVFDYNPYQASNDEGIIYALDAAVWELILLLPQGQQNISIPCRNQGNVKLSGTAIPNTIGQLVENYTLQFTNCLFPNGWETMYFTYNGLVTVAGPELGNNGGNYLDLNAENFHMNGGIIYENNAFQAIHETCDIYIHDDYDHGFGGLTGTICGRDTYVAETDPLE